ncbi:hypothetical protein AeMF1_013732 [Aphanomyces euteiches]|nr:hypothetical protein AeMF1_013732 [Aphanomyces euteiches]
MGARRKKFGGSLAVTTRHLGALQFATPGKTLSLICISTFALMAPQVYFVTGANKVSRFGYEAVRILAEKFGDQAIVLLGTRSLKNGEDAIAKMKQANSSFDYANVHLVEIDVSNKESIQAAADFVKANHGSKEGYEMCFQVNVYGVYETLAAFQPLLVPHQSTNIVVSSGAGAWVLGALSPELLAIFENCNALDIDTLHGLLDDWLDAYHKKPSKYSWPPLQATIILALTGSPRWRSWLSLASYCATDLSNHAGYLTAAQGAENVLYPLFHPEATETGGFYRECQPQAFYWPMPAEFQK